MEKDFVEIEQKLKSKMNKPNNGGTIEKVKLECLFAALPELHVSKNLSLSSAQITLLNCMSHIGFE